MHFFSIKNIFFTVLGYPMSYIEFFGVIAGAIAVWLSAKANIWSWPIGLVNVILFFFLFYQVQLYPDMFLQIFFFVTGILGWWRWANPKPEEEDRKHELKVSYMQPRSFMGIAAVGLAGTFLFGTFAENLHELLPGIFSLPSAYPYMDSFVTVMSVVTTFLMIQKKIESWIIWIVIDAVAAGLYFAKGIKFVGIEYVVFCFLAAFGLWNWIREYRTYAPAT
ncbi:MAG: nicotinamide riboside transporter PnuC [Bacteroidota bacterium]